MCEYIYLQKSLRVKHSDKRKCIIDDEYVDNIDKITINDLLDKILITKENDEPLNEYHEIVFTEFHTKHKLFFDIEFKKKYNSEYFDTVFNDFKNEISSLLASTFINYYKIDNISNYNEEIIKQYILDGIYSTSSNEPNKISLHVFFTNVIITNNAFISLKYHIQNYKKTSENEMVKNIDDHLFRKNTLLRLIYSKKSNSNYYHTEYDYDINTVDDLSKYIITNTNLMYDFILIDSKNVDTDEFLSIPDNVECVFPHLNAFNGHEFLNTFKHDLLEMNIFLDDETKAAIKDLESVELNSTLELKLNIMGSCICGKISHKNTHYLLFTNNNIKLLKHGNSHNCKILYFSYPKLDSYSFTKFIKSLDIIRKVDNDIKLYWDNVKWNPIEDDMIYGKLALNLLDRFKHTMLLHDKKYLSGKYFKEAKIRILTELSINKESYNKDPFLIQLSNGLYDIKNEKFIFGQEAKSYVKLNYIPLEYKDIDQMSDEERKKYDDSYNELINAINKIIPIDHEDREIFECNISTCLLQISKETITFLVGPTKSGKSTIKLLLSALFGNLFIMIPIIDYIKPHNPHNPNAWLGKLDGKLVCFSSEGKDGDVFDSQSIKHMTERVIISRILNSNIGNQRNYATQLIDTNILPKIDISDNAILERLAIININHSYFVNGSHNNQTLNEKLINHTIDITERRVIQVRDPYFSTKIENGYFSLALFNLLKSWVRKYHLDGLKIKHTPEKFIKSINSINSNNNINIKKENNMDNMSITNNNNDIINKDNPEKLTLVSTINVNDANKDIKMHHIKYNYTKYYTPCKKLTRSKKTKEIVIINEKFLQEFNHLIPNEYKHVILHEPYVALEHLLDPNVFERQ